MKYFQGNDLLLYVCTINIAKAIKILTIVG